MLVADNGASGLHGVETLVPTGWQIWALVVCNALDSLGWLDRIAHETSAEVEVISGNIRVGKCAEHATQCCDAVLHLAGLMAIAHSNRAHRFVRATTCLAAFGRVTGASASVIPQRVPEFAARAQDLVKECLDTG